MKWMYLFLMIIISGAVIAQKKITLTKEQMLSTTMTAELVLGLPSAYRVRDCQFFIGTKNYITTFSYSIFTGKCNFASADFPVLWSSHITLLQSGTTVTLDNIIVLKGTREIKWASKVFVTP